MRAAEFTTEAGFDAHRAIIAKTLQSAGYKKLGAGADAIVWGKDAGIVIKILIPDSGKITSAKKTFLAFYKFCSENQDSPFLPKFIPIQGKHYTRFTISGSGFYQIALEKLQRFKPNTPLLRLVLPAMRNASWSTTTFDRFIQSRLHEYFDKDWEKLGEQQRQVLREFYALVKKLSAYGRKHRYSLDIHSGNVMLRGSIPVIIDPWYSGSYS